MSLSSPVSAPPGCPKTIYRDLVRAAVRKEAHVIVDSSGSVLREATRARPFAVKPNREEAHECVFRRKPPLIAIESIH